MSSSSEFLAPSDETVALRHSLSILATFAHEVAMGAYRGHEQTERAKLVLEQTGLLSLDTVVALNDQALEEKILPRKAVQAGLSDDVINAMSLYTYIMSSDGPSMPLPPDAEALSLEMASRLVPLIKNKNEPIVAPVVRVLRQALKEHPTAPKSSH